MTQENKPIIQVKELFQAGIVVRDLEKSIQLYKDLFGLQDWQTYNAGEMLSYLNYKGKPVEKPSFLVGTTMAGNMELELIQPISEDLPYFDFLKDHGEGLHHLGHIYVSDIDEAVCALEAKGFPCIFAGGAASVKFAYIDMTKPLGVIVELIEVIEE